MSQPIAVRGARADDMTAVQAIYAHHVLHGLATFEEPCSCSARSDPGP